VPQPEEASAFQAGVEMEDLHLEREAFAYPVASEMEAGRRLIRKDVVVPVVVLQVPFLWRYWWRRRRI